MCNFKSLVSLAIVLAGSCGQSFAKDDPWFFTAKEIASAYRYQQQFGARLHNPMEPKGCLHGRMEFAASSQGRRFVAPCRFIRKDHGQFVNVCFSPASARIQVGFFLHGHTP
jgi:hypothetical protein